MEWKTEKEKLEPDKDAKTVSLFDWMQQGESKLDAAILSAAPLKLLLSQLDRELALGLRHLAPEL